MVGKITVQQKSFLKMGTSTQPSTLFELILKDWDRFSPQNLKKTHLIFLCGLLHGHGIHWRMANGGQLKGLFIAILFYNYTCSIENQRNG